VYEGTNLQKKTHDIQVDKEFVEYVKETQVRDIEINILELGKKNYVMELGKLSNA